MNFADVDLVGVVDAEVSLAGDGQLRREIHSLDQGPEAFGLAKGVEEFKADGIDRQGVPAEEKDLGFFDRVILVDLLAADQDLEGAEEIEPQSSADHGQCVNIWNIRGTVIFVESGRVFEQVEGDIFEAAVDSGGRTGFEGADAHEGGGLVDGGDELIFAGAEIDGFTPAEVGFSTWRQVWVVGLSAYEENLIGLIAVADQQSQEFFGQGDVGAHHPGVEFAELEADDILFAEKFIKCGGERVCADHVGDTADDHILEDSAVEAFKADDAGGTGFDHEGFAHKGGQVCRGRGGDGGFSRCERRHEFEQSRSHRPAGEEFQELAPIHRVVLVVVHHIGNIG